MFQLLLSEMIRYKSIELVLKGNPEYYTLIKNIYLLKKGNNEVTL